ncbi:RAD55 family ATPase [Rhodanobacter umsongensis]|uniref:non-specific serine/threonine protein kinase n=1 Tax=Rhodanobacter umsongensis TaxID=633153 RepID=A0ABW0JGU1_9GAMM
MIEKFSTGIEGLDRLTDGGFTRGSAYIIQGPPGAGKTILANQFCYSHILGGGRALYMTLLAESSERMQSYIRQLAFFDERAVPDTLQYVSGYGVLERDGLPGLLKLVQHEIRRHNATVMVLDGTFVAQSTASEQEFRKFIHSLQGVAGLAKAVLVMLTHQTRDAGTSPEHTMIDGWIELCDETQGFRAYRTMQVKKHRGGAVLRGKHEFSITRQGINVYPRLEASVDSEPSPHVDSSRLRSGIDTLDELLDGGLPAGSSTLALGPTGSGKTTLGLHFLSQASTEQPALMLGFYETPARLRAKGRSIGLDMDGLIDSGALHLMWQPPSESIVDALGEELIVRAQRMGAKRVLVDGLVAIRDTLIIPQRLPAVINALSARLRDMGATTMYTSEIAQLDMADTVMPADQLSAMVSNVFVLNYRRPDGAFRRHLSIVKLRDSDFDPRSREFHVTARGIAFGPDLRLADAGRAS